MYEDRVAKGAALLDRVRPGWAGEVAADRLAMESCDKCVLGQLYGNYWAGFRALLMPPGPRTIYRAGDFGFTLHDLEQLNDGPYVMARFAALADAWRAEVRSRLAEAPADEEPPP
jgi:hypothetical protein